MRGSRRFSSLSPLHILTVFLLLWGEQKDSPYRIFLGSNVDAFGGGPSCQSLHCRNGGTCEKTRDGNGVRCHCPRGFVGAYCEIEVYLCGSPDEQCFNGQPCFSSIDDDGERYYHCECDSLTSDLTTVFNQRLCGQIATSFCKLDVTNETQGVGEQGGSFCSSAGKCKGRPTKGMHHAGCDCPNSWTGSHCEVPLDANGDAIVATMQETTPVRGSARGLGGAIVGALCGIALVGMITTVIGFVYHGFTGGRRPRIGGPGSGRRRQTRLGNDPYVYEQEMIIASSPDRRTSSREVV